MGRARAWSAELDEAERLARGDEADRVEAIHKAERVLEEAESERDDSQPGRWDDSAWEECTVTMTRASVLLLRLRRGRPSTPPPPRH
jgi:hypothetical protein